MSIMVLLRRVAAPQYKERADIISGAKVVPPKEGEPAGEGELETDFVWVGRIRRMLRQ